MVSWTTMGSNVQFVGQKKDGGSDTAEIKYVKLRTPSTQNGSDFNDCCGH